MKMHLVGRAAVQLHATIDTSMADSIPLLSYKCVSLLLGSSFDEALCIFHIHFLRPRDEMVVPKSKEQLSVQNMPLVHRTSN